AAFCAVAPADPSSRPDFAPEPLFRRRVSRPVRGAVGLSRKPSRLAEPETGDGAIPQRSAQLSPQRLRIGEGALAMAPDLAAAVRFQQQPFDHQSVAVELGEPSDRGAAGAV